MNISWPISKCLIKAILEDKISDVFVVKMIWERLGYLPQKSETYDWVAGPNTPQNWSENFPRSPQIIINRKASIYLTRSIPVKFKQALKEKLNFQGYSIKELFPRRTRRCTAANWLLAWSLAKGEIIPEEGPTPVLLTPPKKPIYGHPGDPLVE